MQGLDNHIKHLEELKLITTHRWKDAQVKEWPVIECVTKKMQFDTYDAHQDFSMYFYLLTIPNL